MTIEYRKKLIEVSLPLAAINAESAREKSIRHGHPSTLHLWWARRPLAACRAVLFSSLVDDPDSDPQYRKADGSVDEEAAGIKRADLFNLIEELVMWENSNNPDVIRTARAEIARCVASRLIETGKLAKDAVIGAATSAWDLVTRGHCRPQSMGLDKKAGRVRFSFDVSRLPPADVVNAFLAEHAPPVLDPFAGGGSIPLEAQRLGLRAYASDLNPVPVLINKALIEIPPKFSGLSPVNPEARGEMTPMKAKSKKGRALVEVNWPGATGLAEDVRYYGQWMRDEADRQIGHLYPKVEVTAQMAIARPDLKAFIGHRLTVIAWIWARTVASPNPSCGGAHVPLIKSFWLAKRGNRQIALTSQVKRSDNTYSFRVACDAQSVESGTIGRKGGRCLISDDVISLDYIRAEGRAHRMGTRLLTIVCDGPQGRIYLDPLVEHVDAAQVTVPRDAPEAEMAHNPFSLRPPLYGLESFSDIFSARQLTALTTLGALIADVRRKIMSDAVRCGRRDNDVSLSSGGDGSTAYADAVALYLAFAIDKAADYWSSLCSWHNSKELIRNTFGRQALPMIWDYAEANPFQTGTGGFGTEWSEKSLRAWCDGVEGKVQQLEAQASVSQAPEHVLCTDPPYYNNIDYADLSDFFYIWLRRSIGPYFPSLFATVATPKSQELVATPYRHDGDALRAKEFFERGLENVFSQMQKSQHQEYPLTVFYAFKQSEESDSEEGDEESSVTLALASTGWETMLEALRKAGLQVKGTWPVRTEMGTRMMSMKMNALASSIVLVCRARSADAALATRKEFLVSLRRELPVALRSLQRGSIAPVDLAQAAIGPGMAVFSRYSRVLESDGSPMLVRTALGLINQTLDEVLAEQEGEFDGETRWALAWFDQFGVDEGPFGDAETLSKAKNTAINGLVEAGVITARAGKVRLVRRQELPAGWNPATDKRLTVWEATQHLIHRLDQQGETGAAELVRQLGGISDVARDLAYRLYSTCERRKWTQEALAYNTLVVAWPELTKLARSQSQPPPRQQQEMFV